MEESTMGFSNGRAEVGKPRLTRARLEEYWLEEGRSGEGSKKMDCGLLEMWWRCRWTGRGKRGKKSQIDKGKEESRYEAR